MKNNLFSYNLVDTPIHRLSGLTKLIAFLLLTFAVMFSYDIRVIICVMIFSFYILKVSQIKFSQIKLMVIYVGLFLITNTIITYLFSPEEGVGIYGTRHEIVHLIGRYSLTMEQIFYQTTKFLKYASVIPLGIIFLLTTNPSEFASSLNRVGVNYKAAYAVALTLRYFPDIQREYVDISLAQQARGLDLSSKAKLKDRFKNALLIIVPLIFSTMDRIELISNAMDLRGFGKCKTRTWYNSKSMNKGDFIAIGISILIFIGTILVSIFINKSRFYNPFI
ncbi:energy-coupling factor transporter transmembrane protein EcfT [Tissierella pigra]|uniref:Energy-coupling factor transporter transmembrane protein EcfT n=1 Tax=Tissierella pigra TaxID=2607614 RepID=A0A6N7XZZ3_9FIRM|nr:energy-coupling factor transporter transmembrane component T [Tissierella pigra]MBU5426016.1 energy-coupling factor transporter transmembrane protein EcfT [Tissierella pigra]MSU03417.1 energy-coupling factor transporter transmembrane protein EcfT [Tissierella pigra]